MKSMALGLINFYRKYLSCIKLRCCRFYPPCSEYTHDAVCKYGFWRGALKSAYRILRCSPLSKGGYDPA